MTKRLIIAAVFLLSSFLLSFLAVNYVVTEIDKTTEIIVNSENPLEASEKILSSWEKNKNLFSLFLKHTDADTIERYYLELTWAYNEKNSEAAADILVKLRAFLQVTAEGEKIKTENIF